MFLSGSDKFLLGNTTLRAFRKIGSDDSLSCSDHTHTPSKEIETQQLVLKTDLVTNTFTAEPPEDHIEKGDTQTQEDVACIHTIIAATIANIFPFALKRNSPNRAVSTSFLI